MKEVIAIKKTCRIVIAILAIITANLAFAQDVWNLLPGPYGGRVNQLFQSPVSGDLWAGTPRGLFEYNVFTNTWGKIINENTGLANNYTQDFFYYEAADELYISIGYQLYRTSDQGNTWENLNITYPGDWIREVARDDDGVLYVGTTSGIYYSLDMGSTWDPYPSIDNFVQDLFFYSVDGNQYLFTSYNDSTFVADITSSFGSFIPVLAEGIQNFEFYNAAVSTTNDIFFASNRGLFAYEYLTDAFVTVNDTLGNLRSVYVSQSDRLVVGGYDGIYSSSDLGASFIEEQPWDANKGGCLSISEVDGDIMLGFDGGVGVERNSGGSWIPDNTGIAGYYISGFAADTIGSNNRLIISAFEGGLYATSDQGQSWSNININNTYGHSIFVDPTTGNYFCDFLVSQDGGATWNSSLPERPDDMEYDAISGRIWCAFEYLGVHYSDDGGLTWTLSYPYSGYDERDLLRTTGGVLFLVRSGYDDTDTSPMVVRSTDNGVTWTGITGSLTWNSRDVSIVEGEPGEIYIGGFNGVHKSVDDGTSWTRLPEFFGQANPNAQEMAYINGLLMVSNYSDILVTSNDGENWKQIAPPDQFNDDYVRGIEYLDESQVFRLTSHRIFQLNQTAVAPTPPTGLTVLQIAPNQVRLTWTPGSNADRHVLYESLDGGNNYTLLTDTLTTTGTLLLDIGDGASVTYKVVAENDLSSEEAMVSITQRTPATPAVSISPSIFTMDDTITVTYYADRSYPVDHLVGSPKVYLHSGPVAPGDEFGAWVSAVGNWGADDSVGIMEVAGADIWEITFVPREYYGTTNFATSQIGMVFRNADGTLYGKQENDFDFYIDVEQTRRVYNLDGDLTDAEGNGNDLVINNAPVFGSDRFGSDPAALVLDGDDAFRTDFVPQEGQPFSVSFWMQRQTELDYQYLDFGPAGPWMFNLGDNFYLYDGSNIAGYQTPDGATGWDHVTMTWDGTETLELYTNGRYLGQQTPGLTFADTLVFGRTNSGFGDDFSGKFDQIIIDSYVIDADQVWSYYENFNPPTDFNLSPAGDQQIQYSYTDIGRPATYYIYRDSAEVATQTSAGSFIDSPVNNGQYYDYYIYSEDDFGNISNVSETLAGVTFNGLEATYNMSDAFTMVDTGPNGYDGIVSFYDFWIHFPDRFGVDENAYYFRFSGDSVVTNQTFADGSAFSISIWANWTNDSSTAFQPLVSWSDTANTNNAYLAVNDQGELSFTDNWSATGVFLPNGDWTHIVATYDGAGTYQIYLDGSLAQTHTGSTALQFGNMYVGSERKFDSSPGANFFNGYFDDYTLFSRLITASEVDLLYTINGWPGTQISISDAFPGQISSGQQDAVITALDITSSNGEVLNGLLFDISNPLDFENYRLYQSSVEGDLGTQIATLTPDGNEISIGSLGINLTSSLTQLAVVADAKVSAAGTLNMTLAKSNISVASFPEQLFGQYPLFDSKMISGVDTDMGVYYPFDGNAFDFSGNDHNGIVIGATPASGRNDEPNTAYLFDEDTDIITSDASFAGPSFTFTTWVNAQNTDFSNPLPILNFGAENPWFGIINGQPSLKGFNNADPIILADEWTHLAVTYESDVTNYYINGELVSTKAGNLNFSGSGLAIGNSSVLYAESFPNCLSLSSFTPVSLIGAQNWSCSEFGLSTKAAGINGFSGSAQENDDWLVSSAIDLSGLSEAFFSFYTDVRYNGPDLKVWISNDYNGDVVGATWTELTATLDNTPDTFDDWTFSGAIDLSAYVGSTVHIAFQYTSIAEVDGAALWKVDDIVVRSTGNAFSGLIDEVRVYNLALTADQIDYLFERSRNGLIAHYPLDGDAVDLIDGNDGAVFGNPNETAKDRFNNEGSAFSFLAEGDFILVPDSPDLDFDQDFSIGIWFKNDLLSGVRHILRKYSGSGSGIEVNTNDQGGIDLILLDDQGNDANLFTDVNFADNQWHKVLISKNSEVINLSVDGVLIGERTTPTAFGSLNNNEPLYIAANSTGTANFVGSLDDIKIYDKFIYSSDLDEDFSEGIEGFLFNSEKYIASWNIGSPAFDSPYGLIMDSQSNLVFTGYSAGGGGNFINGDGESDIVLVKISPTTNELIFSNLIGGSDTDFGWDVTESSDGGYLVTGYTFSTDGDFMSNGDRDVAVFKTNSNGELVWSRALGGPDYDTGRGIVELSDGTIGITGTSISTSGDIVTTGQSRNPFFLRLSADGTTVLNTYLYGDPTLYQDVWDILLTRDGNVVIASRNENIDGWVFKINPFDGSLIWEQTLGGGTSGFTEAWALAEDLEGHILVTGTTDETSGNIGVTNGVDDAYIAKLDGGTGTIVWARTYGGPSNDTGEGIAIGKDGYYLVGGTSSVSGDIVNSIANNQKFLLKTDFDGNVLFSYAYGSDGYDYESDVIVANDNRVYSMGYMNGTGGDYSFSRGAADIIVTNHYSDQNGLYALNFEGQETLPALDYNTNTVSVTTVQGTDLSSLPTRFEGGLYSSLIQSGNALENGTAGQVFQDFNDNVHVGYNYVSGIFTEFAPNPGTNSVNSSDAVGEYIRSDGDQYDVLAMLTDNLLNGQPYEDGAKVLKMDMNTAAPVGTEILLQFEHKSTVTNTPYPAGRHSVYQAFTTVQNAWETLTFSLFDQPDLSVNDFTIDQIVLLVAPNTFTGDTYYFDNLRSEVVSPDANVTSFDFDGATTFDVVSENGRGFTTWTAAITPTLYTENDILDMEVDGDIGDPSINTDNHSVVVDVANAVDLTVLGPVFTLSPGATINPPSGQTRNFTNTKGGTPLEYTVTSEDGVDQVWTVAIGQAESDEANITNFTVPDIVGDPVINETDSTVEVIVLSSTDLTNLEPTIQITPGATISPESGVAQDFSMPVSYTVTAEDGTTTKEWTVTISTQLNNEADIVSFDVTGLIESTLQISASNATIFGSISDLEDITSLTPQINLSFGATINPAPQQGTDFSSPVSYTVTSEDGSTSKEWIIILTEKVSDEADIKLFTFDELFGDPVIDPNTSSVIAEAMIGTDLTALSNVNVGVSVGGQITSGDIPSDFSSPVSVTVQAQDGTTSKTWSITVTEGPNTATEITSFTFADQTADPVITSGESSITGEVSYGVGWPNIAPTITVSDQATISPASGTSRDFTNPVTYTVTAGDGTTRDWTVTITEAPGTEAEIISFTVDHNATTYSAVVNPSTLAIEILLPQDIDFSSIAPTITASPGATIDPLSGTAQDFNSPVDYLVTSGDESINKIWTAYARPADGTGSVGGASFGSLNNNPSTVTKGEGGFTATAPVEEGEFITVTIYYKNVEDPDYQTDATESASGSYSYDFGDTDINDIGVLYYFEGDYEFAGQVLTSTTEVMGTYVVYDENDADAPFVPYDDHGDQQTNYRIIAFPVEDPNIGEFTNSLDGTNENQSEWRLARYNGNDTSPYDYYGTTNFGLDPGIGYFFISKTPAGSLTIGGQTVSLVNGSFLIDLDAGWNLIGNPFLRGLDWADVIQHNLDQNIISSGDIGELQVYEGDYSTGTGLDAFEGGFIEANNAVTDFQIPTSAMTGSQEARATSGAIGSANLDDNQWSMHLMVKSNSRYYGSAAIGLNPEASDDLDKLDMSHLPHFSEYLFVDIEGTAQNRKLSDGFKKWDFTIPNNLKSSTITLSWSELLGSANTIVMVDGASNRIYDLKTESSIDLPNIPSATHSFYFGDKKDIYARLDLNSLAVQNLYPNPVTEDLNLEFYSPQNGVVSYELLSIDGKVSFVDNVSVSKGLNRLTVEDAGSMLADGLYFLKMEGFDNQAVMIKFVIR